MHPPAKIVVAVSGGGRSLKNLYFSQSSLFKVVGVIESKLCPAGEWARTEGLCVFAYHSHSKGSLGKLRDWLKEVGPSLIVLAGFLKKFPVEILEDARVINIHPALLPRFGGLGMYGDRVHRAVKMSGDSRTGCTVHWVDEVYDRGVILGQRSVEVFDEDTPQTIAEKVFEQECILLPHIIEKIIEKNLSPDFY